DIVQVVEETSSTFDEDINEETQPEEIKTFLKDLNECRTFREKLDNSIDAVKNRYNYVLSYVSRVQGISGIETADHQTFVHGSRSVCRMLFRGKTLCILLALEPEDYEGTKYLFTNITRSKVHSEFHMRLKLSSDRQAKWTCELLSDLFARLKLTLLDNPSQIPFVIEKIEEIQEQEQVIEEKIEEIAEEKLELEESNPFAHLKGLRDSRTFKERLEESSEQVKSRYETVTELLYRVDGVRVIDAKKSETFKKGYTPITKLTIKGKTLNAYLGLQPNDYVDSKYIYTDVSDVKAHASYPMRVKVTSDRQARWVNELVTDIANKNSLTILEKPVIKVAKEFSFADLKKKKIKGFKYRLRTLPVARERFDKIKEELSKIEGIRRIDSKTSVTYKLKSTPIVKFTIRGKTLNAYLGLNPNEYLDTKYIFTDVSNVKAYANYPMRVKVTSDRQVKWVNELIDKLFVLSDLKRGEGND
ncbi:MAG: hypothetical protein J6R83_00590, partial [Clostridia bacterium]|nr:hypothetical protein [Clostridia bacterium]